MTAQAAPGRRARLPVAAALLGVALALLAGTQAAWAQQDPTPPQPPSFPEAPPAPPSPPAPAPTTAPPPAPAATRTSAKATATAGAAPRRPPVTAAPSPVTSAPPAGAADTAGTSPLSTAEPIAGFVSPRDAQHRTWPGSAAGAGILAVLGIAGSAGLGVTAFRRLRSSGAWPTGRRRASAAAR